MHRYQIDYANAGNERLVIVESDFQLEEEDVPSALANRLHLGQRQECETFSEVLARNEIMIRHWRELE